MAVGDTIRRLVGKALLSTPVAKHQVDTLAPLQTGVGVKGTTEAIAMGCQAFVDTCSMQAGWVMLKVDMSNAFNTVHRGDVLQGALHYCPSAYNYLATAYRSPAPLFCGGKVLWSREGTHQGCPLGPLGFSLAIQPVLEHLRDMHGLAWQVWYLDDGVLFGDALQVSQAFQVLQSQLADRGLQVNCTKCELWGPGAPQWTGPALRVVPWAPQHGVTVLGVPINYPNTSAYADTFWHTAVQKLQDALDRVT